MNPWLKFNIRFGTVFIIAYGYESFLMFYAFVNIKIIITVIYTHMCCYLVVQPSVTTNTGCLLTIVDVLDIIVF